MYILLAISTLVITTIHGKIIQCTIGGVTENKCVKLINDSVLNKYYIFNFEKYYISSDIDDNDPERKIWWFYNVASMEIDIPYIKYKGDYPEVLQNNIFMIPLFENYDYSHDITALKMYWENYHLVGTDLFRLKFHSKMVNMYKNRYVFSPDEILIFIKSCYNASSIYYFHNKDIFAYNVLQDGLFFINILQEGDENLIDKLEVTTWSVLYQTFQIYLIQQNKEYYSENMEGLFYKLNNEKNALMNMVREQNRKYPIAYTLIYREYLLDEDFINENVQQLIQLIKEDNFMFDEYDKDLNLFYTYYHIVLSLAYNNTDDNNEFEPIQNLIFAVLKPTMNTEDRLLNYVANELLYNTTAITEDNALHSLQSLAYNHQDYTDILANLSYRVYDVSNIIRELIENLASDDDDINENILKVIIIEANNLESYEDGLQKINEAIILLEEYIALIKKKSKHIQKRMFKNKNTCIAYKWLSVFNGFNMLYSDQQILNATNSRHYLELATKCKREYNTKGRYEDTYLDYLNTKFHGQVEKLTYIKVKGLIKSNMKSEMNVYNKTKKDYFNNFYIEFYNLINGPYNNEINKIEAHIYMFGLNVKIYNNIAMNLLKNAIAIPVMNSEDRIRNKEAHELLSVFMVQEKSLIINNQ